MSEEVSTTRDERMMAGLAHGSVLLGALTNGIGGIGVALLIWITQRGKSAYAAAQALQALVYQVVTMLLSLVFWCCWGGLWTLTILPFAFSNNAGYGNAPPPGMIVGLVLMIIPFGFMGLTTLYGLWGAVRCLNGHDFRYVAIGNWLERQSEGE